MKSKKFFLVLLTVFAGVSLVACMPKGSDQNGKEGGRTEQKSSQSAKDLLADIQSANAKLTSVKLRADISLTGGSDNVNNKQTMTGQTIYDPSDQQLTMANLAIEGSENGQKSYQEAVMPGGSDLPFYHRTSKTGGWTKEVRYDSTGYTVNPDYFKLLEGLYRMEDDLNIKESDTEYVLSLKSQNIDLISLFGDEFELKLNGVTQAEMDKVLEVRIDKKTHFLKEFRLELSYSGDKGSLAIKTKTSYSNWNQIKESDISSLIEGEEL